MTTGIGSRMFLNLPISDVNATRAFWSAVDVPISESYSDEHAVSLTFSDHVFAMLLQHDFYRGFLQGREIADTRSTSGCLVCLDAVSREAVDAFVDAAVGAGAAEVPPPDPDPAQEAVDAGLMYGRTFTDLDGHQWEILWMSAEMPEA